MLLLAYIAFVSLGLPDGLLGVAWPSIRADFGLPLDALGSLLVSGTLGYLVSSFFSGRIMARLGVGRLLALSCAATAVAVLGYTLSPFWLGLVLLGVLSGLGAGAIDAGLNAFVAAHFGEHQMQWLHASYGIGVTLGPLLMTGGLNLFASWRVGYWVVGAGQLLLALGFALTLARWQEQRSPQEIEQNRRLTDYRTSLRATLRQPGAWLSALLFFCYTGIELGLGHWTYSLLTESRAVPPALAGLWAGGYWAAFTLGRLLAGFFTRRIHLETLLRFSMLGALAGALLLWLNLTPALSLFGVALTGFCLAPIFPGLVSGTDGRVAPQYAANTIGIQLSAAGLGAALLPGLAGMLASRLSLEVIPLYLCALLILLSLVYNLSLRRPSAALGA